MPGAGTLPPEEPVQVCSLVFVWCNLNQPEICSFWMTLMFSPTGLSVCVLADYMFQGAKPALPDAHCRVHPDTSLEWATHQQLYHLHIFSGPLLLIVHIGTNNVAQGDSPYDIIRRMRELIIGVREYRYEVKFAVCSILPQPKDNATTKRVVKETKQHFGASVTWKRWCNLF